MGQPEMEQDVQAEPHLEPPVQTSSDWEPVSPGRRWKGRRWKGRQLLWSPARGLPGLKVRSCCPGWGTE